MIETDDFTSMQYVVDLDSKRFGPIEDIFAGVIPSMRQYGLNVHVSDIRPNKSYTEDRQLIVKLKWKVELTHLLWSVNEKQHEITAMNGKGIIFYQRMPSGKFVLGNTDIVDREILGKLNCTMFIRHIFPLPDDNIVESIKQQIKILYNSL